MIAQGKEVVQESCQVKVPTTGLFTLECNLQMLGNTELIAGLFPLDCNPYMHGNIEIPNMKHANKYRMPCESQ